MFEMVGTAETALEEVAAGLDPTRLSGDDALQLVRSMGKIVKLAEAICGLAALQVDATGAHRRVGDRSSVDTVAKAFGIHHGTARRLVETAATRASGRARRPRAPRSAPRASTATARRDGGPTTTAWSPATSGYLTALTVSGRECCVAGRGARDYLELDHDLEVAKGGPTSWDNVGWLCYRHHRLKSEGWQLGPRDPVTRKRRLVPPGRRRSDAA